MTDVLMPALSPTMEEGALAKWLVKVGDKVRAGDVIAEIETDKATMEVEAVDEGVVSEILVPEGAEGVKVNTPIARLGEGGAQAKPAPAPQASAPAQPAAKSEPAAAAAPKASASPAPSPARMNGTDARLAASPLARRIAAQRGIDLAQVAGSGPHGRIVRADVERAAGGTTPAPAAAPAPTAAAPSVAPAAPASAPGPAKSLEQMGIPPGSYDLVPLDGMKKTVARRLTESFRDVPHFPLTIDVELDALLAARARINAMPDLGGVKVSVNDLVIKAVAVALMRVPDANASYSPEGIARHHHADIAVAVAIDGGLITPIVRAAESKGLLAIAAETKDLAERARARKLKPDEYTGGTFSVSNLGMMGIRSFASILNPPQGAILSVGAGEKRPVVRDGELAVATVMTVTLTCDHRVLDGAIGARWLAVFKAAIEDPLAMIL